MLRIVVVFLVVLVAAMFLLPRGQRGAAPENATELPQPTPLADVRFVDKSGQETHLSDLKGDFTLVFFGFTNCPDVCPTTLLMMSNALAKLGPDADRLKVLFVSVDPERDTPEHLRTYMSSFDRHIIGLTGSAEQVAAT